MDQQDGQIEAPVQLPQVAEQGGDGPDVVLVLAVKPDQRVEQQQLRPKLLDGASNVPGAHRHRATAPVR